MRGPAENGLPTVFVYTSSFHHWGAAWRCHQPGSTTQVFLHNSFPLLLARSMGSVGAHIDGRFTWSRLRNADGAYGLWVRSARKMLLPAATAGVDAEANVDTAPDMKDTMSKCDMPMKSAKKAQALVNHILKSTVKRMDKMDLKTASGRTRALSKTMPRVEEAAQTPILPESLDMSVALNAAARTPSSSISSGNDVNVEDFGDDSELTHIFINSPKQMSRKSFEDGVNGSSPFRFDVSSQTTPSSKDQSAFRCASPMPAPSVEPSNRRESLVSDPVARTLSAEKDVIHAVGDDERQTDVLGLRAPQPVGLTDRPNDTSPQVVCKYATACC